MRTRIRQGFVALVLLFGVLCGGAVHAGGGPENVFLVYNSASEDSKEIAEFYAGIRRIPKNNLFGVEWRGDLETTSVKAFRSDLLIPLIKEINKRGIAAQIDYVIYSCDFPWQIDLRADTKDYKGNKGTAPYASLTGATYLYQLVLAKTSAILGLSTNWYVPSGVQNLGFCTDVANTPSRGFSGKRGWVSKVKTKAEGKSPPRLRYLLSTMLACTQGRGNTVAEAKAYLKRAALADSVTPEGSFYFFKHGGVRSKPRHACYEQVAASLRALGAKAKVVKQKTPSNINDALGVMLGSSGYNLTAGKVTLMPGAIGDNLTSYGGVLDVGSSQTPLSEMLRHGAAGASGTVYEPTALQAKFPLPTLMLHYRRGCSLAESFYQSIASPYQLLIVGDPLCQPWAKPPQVVVPGLQQGQILSKPIVIRPKLKSNESVPVKSWELYIDGRLKSRLRANDALRVDPKILGPGTHELRVVGVGGSSIEPRASWIGRIAVPEGQAGGSEDAVSAGASPAAL